MSDSLRDQLLGLGFKPPATPAAPAARPKGGKPGAAPGAGPRPRHGESQRAGKGQGGPKPAPGARPRPGQGPGAKPRGPRRDGEIDLAKAYAIRAQREKDERIEAERQKQEAARERREARAKLEAMLAGKALNAADADVARHFEYGGKIKRIHVTAEQLRALNAGELGVVQLNGRYVLVTAAVLEEAGAIFPPAVALRIDPSAPAADDPYADPKYQVPDDLVW